MWDEAQSPKWVQKPVVGHNPFWGQKPFFTLTPPIRKSIWFVFSETQFNKVFDRQTFVRKGGVIDPPPISYATSVVTSSEKRKTPCKEGGKGYII